MAVGGARRLAVFASKTAGIEEVVSISFAEGTCRLVAVTSMLKPMASDTVMPPQMASIAVAAAETHHFAAGAALMAAAVSMLDTEGVASIVVAAGMHRLISSSVAVADTEGVASTAVAGARLLAVFALMTVRIEGVASMSLPEGTCRLVVVMVILNPMAADIAGPPWVLIAVETHRLAVGAAAVSVVDTEGVASVAAAAAGVHYLTVVVAAAAALSPFEVSWVLQLSIVLNSMYPEVGSRRTRDILCIAL